MQLTIQNISKKYNRNKYGIKDFSLTLKPGILGLLGPNGAGKSTLMRILASISKPTEGKVLLDGEDVVKHPNKVREILGYLPQDFGVYPNLNAYEFLEYIAAMKGVGGSNIRERIAHLLEDVNLIDAAKSPIGSYSGGMKQRIGIAQVLLNDPKILIFDEPTVGLDPEERLRFRQLLSDRANDAIILLSSHIVSDIESIADEVAIMKGGSLLAHGTLTKLVNKAEGKVYEQVIPTQRLADFKEHHAVVHTTRHSDGILVRYLTDQPSAEGKQCVPSLEDAYLSFTR